MLGLLLGAGTLGALAVLLAIAGVHDCDRDRCRACQGSGAIVVTIRGRHTAELCRLCTVGRELRRQNTATFGDDPASGLAANVMPLRPRPGA